MNNLILILLAGVIVFLLYNTLYSQTEQVKIPQEKKRLEHYSSEIHENNLEQYNVEEENQNIEQENQNIGLENQNIEENFENQDIEENIENQDIEENFENSMQINGYDRSYSSLIGSAL